LPKDASVDGWQRLTKKIAALGFPSVPEPLATVVIRVGMPPVPIIVLFPFLYPSKVAIAPLLFLEVPPVRLILAVIPGVEVIMGLIFVTPALLVMLTPVLLITVLGDGCPWNNQGRAQRQYFKIVIHAVLLEALSCMTMAIHIKSFLGMPRMLPSVNQLSTLGGEIGFG
jgi:hypothetical protein